MQAVQPVCQTDEQKTKKAFPSALKLGNVMMPVRVRSPHTLFAVNANGHDGQ
jgi:hypothetical protein